jgi:hypothetical protein
MGHDTRYSVETVNDLVYAKTFWTDMRASNTFRRSSVNLPTDVVYPTNGAVLYAFDTNDLLGFTVQMDHSWKPGTDLVCHVHWTPGTRGVAENAKTVAWKVNLSIADISGGFPAITTYDCTDTCDGVNDKHQVQAATVDVDMASFSGLSPVLLGRIYRDGGDTWVGSGANAPILLEVDFHYQKGRPGSRAELTY